MLDLLYVVKSLAEDIDTGKQVSIRATQNDIATDGGIKSHRNDIATGGGTNSHKTDIATGSHASVVI